VTEGEVQMAGKLVGIVLGSDSDIERMTGCFQTLEELGIPFEIRILSAHRTPEMVADYGRQADERGVAVIIAAAGLAAHLPGAMAAHTLVPVIGVPVAGGALGGVDALYSMAQMPGGVPVAVMGIDNGKNAALFAAQILAGMDPGLKDRLAAHRERMAGRNRDKDKRLQEVGWKAYTKSERN